MAELCVLFHYSAQCRNSINALLGALDNAPDLEPMTVEFAEDDGDLIPHVVNLVRSHGKVMVCFSFFSSQSAAIQKRLRRLRAKVGGAVFFLAGGPHATGAPKDTLDLGFDVVVRGEGEVTFPELLRRLKSGTGLSGLSGVAYRDDRGQYHDQGQSEPVDLDKSLPFSNKYRKMGSLEVTRGCVFGCHFCQVSRLCGRRVRHRSPESVFAYARALAERNMKQVRLLSPNAFSYGSPDGHQINLQAMEVMLSGLKRILGPQSFIFFGGFPSEVRPEFVSRDTVDLILKYAANRRLVIGAQSGSDRMLKACHRGHTVSQVYAAVETLCAMKIEPVVDFIFSLPGETKEDAQATLKMMRELAAQGAKLHAHTFMPLPGTKFEHEKPRKVREEIRQAVLREFIPKGALFGQWEKQERVVRR